MTHRACPPEPEDDDAQAQANRWASGRFVLRPATLDDLDALERMAADSAIGISSLQPDRQRLRQRLAHAVKSFASDDAASGEESYVFVLEDRARAGAVVGTSGIEASAGFHDRFYSYRNEFVVQVSPSLGARNRIHTLHLGHDLTGVSLLSGFHIDPAYADSPAPQLLSRGRLLFIAQHPERFADRIASENPGLADDTGRCPFWDAVGRRFFNMDYPSAEAAALGPGRSLIAELLPQSPIYVPLLPDEAQWALGQLHPVAELPFAILQDEGFEAETYLNIFDGGPTATASLALLRSVASRRLYRWPLPAEALAATAPLQLAANTQRQGFRATLASPGPALAPLLHLAPGEGVVLSGPCPSPERI